MTRLKRCKYAGFAVLLLALTACDDSQKKIAKELVIVANVVGTFQDGVMEAENSRLLTVTQARSMMQASIKISETGLKIDAIVRSVEKLTPEQRRDILELLTEADGPLTEAMIFLPGSSERVNALKITLQSLRASLNAIRLAAAA